MDRQPPDLNLDAWTLKTRGMDQARFGRTRAGERIQPVFGRGVGSSDPDGPAVC